MSNAENITFVFVAGLIVFGLVSFMLPIIRSTETHEVELWYTQAPFGVIYADTSGSFIWGSGSINTSPSEAYSAKYWQNDKLQSLVLDATETPIKVDGTFKLTITTKIGKNIYGVEMTNPKVSYELHLPSLPTNVSIGIIAP